MIEPFRISIGQPVLDDLRRRLVQTGLPPSPEKPNWEDGTDLSSSPTWSSIGATGRLAGLRGGA